MRNSFCWGKAIAIVIAALIQEGCGSAFSRAEVNESEFLSLFFDNVPSNAISSVDFAYSAEVGGFAAVGLLSTSSNSHEALLAGYTQFKILDPADQLDQLQLNAIGLRITGIAKTLGASDELAEVDTNSHCIAYSGASKNVEILWYPEKEIMHLIKVGD